MNLRERILEHVCPGGIEGRVLFAHLSGESRPILDCAVNAMVRDGVLKLLGGRYYRVNDALLNRSDDPPVTAQARIQRVAAAKPKDITHIRRADARKSDAHEPERPDTHARRPEPVSTAVTEFLTQLRDRELGDMNAIRQQIAEWQQYLVMHQNKAALLEQAIAALKGDARAPTSDF